MKWFFIIPALSALGVGAGFMACQNVLMKVSLVIFLLSWLFVGIFHEEFEE